MECRLGCGACCIAPSITSAIPDMPNGKPAGQRCVQLDERNLCRLFGDPSRPDVCLKFHAVEWICGDSDEFAMTTLIALEDQTAYDPNAVP